MHTTMPVAISDAEAVEELLRTLPLDPPRKHTGEQEPSTAQWVRIYVLIWAWQGTEIQVSSARLRLTPDEAQDLSERCQALVDANEMATFRLEVESTETLSYPEFLENTPALWTPGTIAEDERTIRHDEAIGPENFQAHLQRNRLKGPPPA